MKKSKILFLILILFVSTSFIFAGYYFEQQTTQSGSQGEKSSISKTWLDYGKIRVDNKGTIVIINNQKVLMIRLKNKTYSEMEFEQFRSFVSMGMKMLKQMMKSQNNGIKVTVTGEKKVIGEYPCYKVIMDVYGIKSTTWYTKKIEIPKKLYMELSKLTMSKEDFETLTNNPEYKKIQGFPVESLSSFSFMGMTTKTVTKLLKFTKMNIPSSVFSYNLSGFTKKDLMQGRGGM